MGKEAKAKKARETRFVLPKEDYFELRAVIRDCEAIELDAMKAAQRYANQQHEAQQRRNATYEALAKAHGFDPTLTYRFDDKALALVAVKMPAAGGDRGATSR